jgi:hypothetical protein
MTKQFEMLRKMNTFYYNDRNSRELQFTVYKKTVV